MIPKTQSLHLKNVISSFLKMSYVSIKLVSETLKYICGHFFADNMLLEKMLLEMKWKTCWGGRTRSKRLGQQTA